MNYIQVSKVTRRHYMLELLHKEISSTELEGDMVAVAFTEEEEEAVTEEEV